ncbi:MAG: asparagine synthase-related protein [Longimicrobiales bacterium]
MSGLAAIFRFDEKPVGPQDLAPSLASLDAWGERTGLKAPASPGAPAGLGIRSRDVMREDTLGCQPVTGGGGDYVLVADARIDNRAELASQLGMEAGGRDVSDGGIILAAYEAWGERAPRHLIGDFAFVVWDAKRRALFAARDPLGRRVLFYHRSRKQVAIASSVRALTRLPDVPFLLSERKVAEFLVLLEDAETTFWEEIVRLPPAHTMTVSAQGVTLERYWALEHHRVERASDQAYLEGFLDVFGTAVRDRLRTTGGVSVMLSGGLDSSSVTGMAAKHLAAEGRRITAFHAAPRKGFDGEARPGWVVDESDDVRAIAAMHENVDLRILRPGGRSPLETLDAVFDRLASPVRNPINLPWVETIWSAARDSGAKVLLSGQKGNATISFSGYRSLREYLTGGRIGKLMREVRALAGARGRSVRDVLVEDVLIPALPPRAMAAVGRLRGKRAQPIWRTNASAVRPEFAKAMHVEERARDKLKDEWSRRHASAFTYRMLMLTHGGDRPDVGHAFGAHFGVEPRDPTSDVRVIEYCLGIPGDQYLRGGTDRSLVRRAMRGLVPDRILDKTKRGAQASDWYEQFQPLRGQFADAIERIEASATARECLDTPRLRGLVENWPTPLTNRHLADYSFVLTRGVAMGLFIVWYERERQMVSRG